MKLKVKSTVGLATPVDIDIEPKETIKEVKDKIATMQACDTNGIALQHQGKLLNENARIKEYGINDGDTIEVIPKNRQGGLSLPHSFINNRISMESQMIKKEGISLRPSTPFFWHGTIYGKGKWKGEYKISISLPEGYPYAAPIVRWETHLPFHHPNIFSATGGVCLNILYQDWRPHYTMITVYRSLEWLLEHPNHEGRLPQIASSFLEKIIGRPNHERHLPPPDHPFPERNIQPQKHEGNFPETDIRFWRNPKWP